MVASANIVLLARQYKSRQIPVFLVIFFLYCFPIVGFSSTDSRSDQQSDSTTRKLEGNEPSYFVFVPEHKLKVEENRTNVIPMHLEFMVSVRYPIADKVGESIFYNVKDILKKIFSLTDVDKCNCVGSSKIYFLYKGEYDFFAGETLPSSPVVSRIQNPGIAWHYVKSKSDEGLFRAIKFGYYHESNGQFFDQKAYERTPASEVPYDNISRGWDYFGLEVKWQIRDNIALYFNPRFFTGMQAFWTANKEDNIFWNSNENSRITEFDGLRAVVSYNSSLSSDVIYLPYRVSFVVRSGTNSQKNYLPENPSYRFELTTNIMDFPFTIFYFNGYGENLSLYQRRSEYFGIGMEIW